MKYSDSLEIMRKYLRHVKMLYFYQAEIVLFAKHLAFFKYHGFDNKRNFATI